MPSIFAAARSKVFSTYHVEIAFRDKLMGGTPKDPRLIEGWLRAKAGLTDDVEELRQATLRTLAELGAEVRPDMSFAEMEEASKSLAAQRNTNGFKRDALGLYVESRTIKSMLKESTNVLFAGDRWGATNKGPRSFLAERVFIEPDHITLDRLEPDGIELFIGHTNGPSGPQSNLTYVEFVQQARITFQLMLAQADDVLSMDEWEQLWLHAQENGLGALRSQGFGRFDVEAFSMIEPCENGFRTTELLKRRATKAAPKGKKALAAEPVVDDVLAV